MPATHPHAHSSRSSTPRSPGGGRLWLIAVVITAVAVVAVGTIAIVHKVNSDAAMTSTASARDASSAVVRKPLTVASTTPANQATAVPSDATISVQFSAPLSPSSPTPTLSPAVPGSWQLLTPTTFSFVATSPLVPSSTETVTIPAGSSGIKAADGTVLDAPATVSFTVADGSMLRLQQLLAELNYLPLSFTAAAPLSAPQEAAEAQQGTFAWTSNEPASLTAQWTVGTANVITTGAVMNFENQNGLKTDGDAGPAVWTKLLAAAAAGTMNTQPYNYVYVVEAPTNESATVYSNGNEVFSTPANTGVAGAATQPGTFPVDARYTVTTMSGTNPDGSTYVDPGIKWVSYFNGGDALHAYPRASYGFPQSDGCVEMPEAAAATVFPLTPIGTLVTVS